MFAGSASLALPDWSVLAAVPVELDMDMPPPEGPLLQSSALSREGALTLEEAALVNKGMRLAKLGQSATEKQPPNLPEPTEPLVIRRPAAARKRPAAAVMKRPAAAAAGERVSQKRPAAKKS